MHPAQHRDRTAVIDRLDGARREFPSEIRFAAASDNSTLGPASM
jgi:hypothetical protein